MNAGGYVVVGDEWVGSLRVVVTTRTADDITILCDGSSRPESLVGGF